MRRSGGRGSCRTGPDSSRRKLHMENMYEVLRFIEHGTHCRQSMDCVRGLLLLDYLKEHPETEKRMLLIWFRQLAVCVDQYHRCRSGQNYRYLNPCSVVVSEEKELLLLDLESAGNDTAVKQMQKRSMRAHFVKPVYEMGVSRNNEADLYSYGKTVQFMLAYSEISPDLTRWEEYRLSRLIGRCTGESGKKYEDFRQVLKDLPAASGKRRNASGRAIRRTGKLAAGAGACILLCAALALGRGGAAAGREEQEEEILEQALAAYARLIEIEEEPAWIEQAGIRKMELEAEAGQYRQAVLTGMQVMKKVENSEKILLLIEKYKELEGKNL